MGVAARQRSFQRALSVSAYNGMDWSSRRGSAWTSKVREKVWALRQGVLRPLDHQTEEKLPSQGLQKLSRRPTHGSGPLDKGFQHH